MGLRRKNFLKAQTVEAKRNLTEFSDEFKKFETEDMPNPAAFVEFLIKSAPMEKYAGYSAWNFYGEVCFDGAWFHCDIWKNKSFVKTIFAESLEKIMKPCVG